MKRSVSVVIPCYNHARYLCRAVAGTYWQLGPADQIIIVDDASTDGPGPHLITPFMDRVLWLRNETNRGLPGSRNRAILASTAEWIKFLDADDALAPFALNAIHEEEELPEEIKVLTGGCHRVSNRVYFDFLHGADVTLPNILHRNPILCSATFVRRQALLDVGLFDERLDFEEDWDMWLRLHEKFGLETFAVTDQPFCFYWVEAAERSQAEQRRTRLVEGLPVREYFRKRYGADPW